MFNLVRNASTSQAGGMMVIIGCIPGRGEQHCHATTRPCQPQNRRKLSPLQKALGPELQTQTLPYRYLQSDLVKVCRSGVVDAVKRECIPKRYEVVVPRVDRLFPR